LRRSNPLYALLFLLVIGAAVVVGYVVASSVKIGPPRPLAILDRLATATPTAGHVQARLLTPTGPGGEAMTPIAPHATLAVPTPAAPTVVVPTFPPNTVATATPAASPPAGKSTPSPAATTPTVTPSPSATPTRSNYLFLPASAPVGVEERGCFVGAVFGYVHDELGQPLPGVQLRVYDPWNHNFPTITKQPPDTGYYDVILGTGAATYYVVVVDAVGNQVSPTVAVVHPEGARACWYQVDFHRTRPQ